ncbi:MAG: hypothetical protein ACI8PV_001787 [Dinoroseobacter sp.]|jgi:hypothetical protein
MIRNLFIVISVMLSFEAVASGNSIGKIVTPYVQQLEKEIEYE